MGRREAGERNQEGLTPPLFDYETGKLYAIINRPTSQVLGAVLSLKRAKGGFPMPTQEERLTALEQTFTKFQKETAAHIRETEENTTIMLGVMRSQGQDVRRIFERLETIDSRLETIDEHVNAIERRLDRLETTFTEHTTLLTQILARLPKTLYPG